MPYAATQRCTYCHSDKTAVRLEYGPKKHIAHDPDVKSVWSCTVCRKDFAPSEIETSEPILQCTRCRTPMPHKFLRFERRQYQPVINKPEPPVHHIESHVFYCLACKTERVYGCHGA